jgi:hypothetical protein
VYLNAIGRLIIDFHRSKFDLLLAGIRLHYQYFLDDKFFTDTMADICNLGSPAPTQQ